MKRIMMKFVSSLLIVALLAASVPALASSAYILKVSVGSAKKSFVRSEDGEKIGTLRNGTRVLYWGHKVGQMLKVMTPNGKVGYVYQGNLKRYGAMSTKQLYVTESAAKLYKRSGSSMHRKGSVGKGVPLIVYKSANGWSMVKNLAGKTSYIHTSDLTKIS